MPTSKPRLNVTLEPELYELLLEIGRYQRCSAASIARDLIESAAPAFRSLVAVQRAQAAAADAHPEQVQKAVSEALQEHFGIGLEQMDLIDALAAVLGSGEADEDGADRSGSEDRTGPDSPAQPPYSNTGVSSDQNENIAPAAGGSNG